MNIEKSSLLIGPTLAQSGGAKFERDGGRAEFRKFLGCFTTFTTFLAPRFRTCDPNLSASVFFVPLGNRQISVICPSNASNIRYLATLLAKNPN